VMQKAGVPAGVVCCPYDAHSFTLVFICLC